VEEREQIAETIAAALHPESSPQQASSSAA
jgi:hypothetical protein